MRFVKDPLNLVATAVAVVWLVVGIWFRPLGDFGVETDFFGDFVPFAREWMNGNPSIMLGYRGPFYYLLIGFLSVLGDPFLLAKILSALCAGVSLRIIGGLLRRLWNPTVAVAGVLFLAANPTLISYSYRACTDLVFLALFSGTMALLFTENRRHFSTWAVAGICAGLAYLTRYNGAALVPAGIMAAMILVRPWKRAALTCAAFGGAWLAVTSGWLWFLWSQTGDPFWNRNFALIAEEVYGTDPTLANIGQLVDSVGFASLGEVIKVDPGRFLGTMAGNFPRHLWLDIQQLVGPWWAMVSLAGWVLSLKSGWNRRRLTFALAGLVFFTSLLPVFYNERFMLTLLIWWAAGVGIAVNFLMAALGFPGWARVGASEGAAWRRFLMIGLPVLLVLTAGWATRTEILRSQGQAGGPQMPLAVLKLAESVADQNLAFNRGTPIAARKPHIGFLLGAPVVTMASEGQMKNLAAEGMHYLLVSDIESRLFPSLAPMLSSRRPTREFPGYRFIAGARHQEKSGAIQKATLYSVENSQPWSPPDPKVVLERTPSPEGLDRIDFLRARLTHWYLNWTLDPAVLPLFDLMKPASRKHPLVMAAEGDAFLAKKNYLEAVEIYEDLLEGPDGSTDTILRLSLAHHLAGNAEEFDTYLHEYADRVNVGNDQTVHDWVADGSQLCRLRKFVPAAGLLNQVLTIDPASPITELHRLLGYSYLNFRHPQEARKAFSRYLELVPDDPEITDILKNDMRLNSSGP